MKIQDIQPGAVVELPPLFPKIDADATAIKITSVDWESPESVYAIGMLSWGDVTIQGVGFFAEVDDGKLTIVWDY